MKKLMVCIAVMLSAAVFASDVSPKVLKGSTLAFVENSSAADENADYKAYMDKTEQTFKSVPSVKRIVDFFDSCGFDFRSVEWSMSSVGPLTRPADDAEKFDLPDISVVLLNKRPVTFEPLISLWKTHIPEKLQKELADNVTFAEESIAGVKAYTLAVKREVRDVFPDFKPCLGILNGNMVIAAFSESAFIKQVELYRDGKGDLDERYAAFLVPSPVRLDAMLLPQVGALVSSLAKEEELAMLGDMPDGGKSIADLLKGLGDFSFATDIKDGIFKYSLRQQFKDAADAESVNALLGVGVMFLKGELRKVAAAEEDAFNKKLTEDIAASISCRTVANDVVIDATIPVEDFLKIDTEELEKRMQLVKASLAVLLADMEDDDDDDDDEDDDE